MTADVPTIPRPDGWPFTGNAPWCRVLDDGRIELHDVQPEFALDADLIPYMQDTGHLTISEDGRIYRFHMANGDWTYRVVGIVAGTRDLVLRMPD